MFPTILNTETYDYKTALTATVSNTGLPATTNGPPPAICPIPKSVTPAVVSNTLQFRVQATVPQYHPPGHPHKDPSDPSSSGLPRGCGAMEERKEPDKNTSDKHFQTKKYQQHLQTKYRLKASSSRNDNCRDVTRNV
ncbi:hypothetical protein BV898_12959 [Hypsibius exemplaris]|uniref:Uncharacterized protein n=1 Tax=Hypsibius exemplaris TaxID=2072580 RepID=A0A1W0WCC5_HYPEX|nr:hypothetical protein BV898_12959 [Hypsibius exemplaris]